MIRTLLILVRFIALMRPSSYDDRHVKPRYHPNKPKSTYQQDCLTYLKLSNTITKVTVNLCEFSEKEYFFSFNLENDKVWMNTYIRRDCFDSTFH